MRLATDTIDVWTCTTRPNADGWTVKAILAGYLDVPANAVRMGRSATGKPMLDPAVHGADAPQFSVSHARGTLVIAIATRSLGIDIERLDPTGRPLDGLLRYLAPRERETLDALPEDARWLATLNCWTRKEAYAKATGEGLSIGLERYEVSCAPGEPPALLRFDDRPDEPGRWQLLALPPIAGVVGTIAIETTTPLKIRLRAWHD